MLRKGIILFVLLFVGCASMPKGKNLIEKGYDCYTKEKYDEAISFYNKELETNLYNELAYVMRGYAYIEKKNYDLAIDDANKAIKIKAKNGGAFCMRGIAYSTKGNIEEACSDLKQSINLGFTGCSNLYNTFVKGSLCK